MQATTRYFSVISQKSSSPARLVAFNHRLDQRHAQLALFQLQNPSIVQPAGVVTASFSKAG